VKICVKNCKIHNSVLITNENKTKPNRITGVSVKNGKMYWYKWFFNWTRVKNGKKEEI